MSPQPPPKTRLTPGEWIAVISLTISLLAGFVDLRVQVATLTVEVARLRQDVDHRMTYRAKWTRETSIADRWDQTSTEIPRMVSAADLGGTRGTETETTRAPAALLALPGDGTDRPGDRRGPCYCSSRDLVGILRRRKSAIAL